MDDDAGAFALWVYSRRLSRFETAYSPKCLEVVFSEVRLATSASLRALLENRLMSLRPESGTHTAARTTEIKEAAAHIVVGEPF